MSAFSTQDPSSKGFGAERIHSFRSPLVSAVPLITDDILEVSSKYGTRYGLMFAGSILASIPMLLSMRGLAAGGIKN